ncbi:SDR family NAD(P)-dependent oxidoreductase [Mycobacterium lacus]|nr:SDR family NAD(P)-dependent oxidoreductase [Mycobacterium lacus]MCV7123179.1 SDR family NAD(P)-dependent oxidoreductase [Mycobacterium lacus]ORW10322.1 short-chain dehydrogenase [Mycobacterium lacus]
MTNRTIVITGASDGIGAAAARRLSAHGEKVVVVGRSESKTTAVARELGADYFVADFADLSAVRALADKIRAEYPRIDVLANNAGMMVHKVHLTPDGYEMTYQVNYLAPFLLTTQLLDLLVASRATIVNTTSSSHRLVRLANVADVENTGRRRPSVAYAYSKLAIVLFTKELHRRYHDQGLAVAAVHPGYVNSNFGVASESRVMAFMARYTPAERFTSTVDQGADQLVWLASSTPGVDWTSGEYYSRRRVAKANRAAYDLRLACELWERTLARLA